VRATTTGTFSLVATVLGADSTRGRPAPDAAALRRLQAGDGIDRHRAKALAELFDWLHGPAAGR